MKPVIFPEHLLVIADGQPMHADQPDGPKFYGLPAYYNNDETISCWSLTWKERLRLLFGRPLWVRQLNWGRPLQGVHLQVERPFIAPSTADMISEEL